MNENNNKKKFNHFDENDNEYKDIIKRLIIKKKKNLQG